MRLSAKGRYALAATIHMAQEYGNGECITVISISEKLNISKIYLEQVFSLLKRGNIVTSIKGALGGYMLTRPPMEITAYDVLLAVETSLFEETEAVVGQEASLIDLAMKSILFQPLDQAIEATLKKITLEDFSSEVQKAASDQALMFFI